MTERKIRIMENTVQVEFSKTVQLPTGTYVKSVVGMTETLSGTGDKQSRGVELINTCEKMVNNKLDPIIAEHDPGLPKF